jgi:hypothetical protein
LRLFLVTSDEPLTDDETGIAIRMTPHLAVWTPDQGRTRAIAFFWLPLRIADHRRVATSTFPAGVTRVDPTGDDALIPRFVLGVFEDAALHPVGAFLIAATAILLS